MKRWVGEPITFIEKDDQGVQFLHDDVVVVSLNIKNCNECHILIDNRSLANVLYYDAFLKIEISHDQLEG